MVLTVNLTENFSPCSFSKLYRQADTRNAGTPANYGAFATLDRRAWEIVEFPVDGESRMERSLEISKSGLHGRKHPTVCVPRQWGVSGEIHRKVPQPRAEAGVALVDRRAAHDAIVCPIGRIVDVFGEGRVWSEQSGRSRPSGNSARSKSCSKAAIRRRSYPRSAPALSRK